MYMCPLTNPIGELAVQHLVEGIIQLCLDVRGRIARIWKFLYQDMFQKPIVLQIVGLTKRSHKSFVRGILLHPRISKRKSFLDYTKVPNVNQIVFSKKGAWIRILQRDIAPMGNTIVALTMRWDKTSYYRNISSTYNNIACNFVLIARETYIRSWMWSTKCGVTKRLFSQQLWNNLARVQSLGVMNF